MHVIGSTQKVCPLCEKRTLHFMVEVRELVIWICEVCKLKEATEEVARE